jgi:hypothetical protein
MSALYEMLDVEERWPEGALRDPRRGDPTFPASAAGIPPMNAMDHPARRSPAPAAGSEDRLSAPSRSATAPSSRGLFAKRRTPDDHGRVVDGTCAVYADDAEQARARRLGFTSPTWQRDLSSFYAARAAAELAR